jgi:glycosyltransferase involved in cell wall biosynthesis
VRILIAHSFYRLAGGEDAYVQRQVELLRRQHDVTLLERSNRTLPGGARSALRMIWSPSTTSDVETGIARFRPDVVHLHNAYPSLGPAVHLAAKRRGVPLVMTVHNARLRCPNGLMFTQGSTCHRCENGLYAHAVVHGCFPSRAQAAAYAAGLWVHRFPLALERRTAIFVAPSAFMAGQLTRWGIRVERVATVPNFTPTRPDATPEPGAYGLYLGRLAGEKGLDVLLRALAEAGDPPFRIVGTGPLEPGLRKLASEFRLRNTEFVGHLSPQDVDQNLRAARFVALPSVCAENSPLAALEAMAAGRPLLVSAAGGLPELAADGRGTTCPVGDPGSLARAIAALMRDDERCRDAGSRGLEYAESNLDPEVHRQRLEAVYERASRNGAKNGTSA